MYDFITGVKHRGAGASHTAGEISAGFCIASIADSHTASTTLGNDIYVIGGTVSRAHLFVDSVQIFTF
ncbi:MAG TPA: hypothetical protein DGF36_06950 [Alteromonas sp.]|nr:hypothetical protein [Alteromonas sp.]HCL13262.1 hypothetical protein [Alteromonas sp.]HCV17848.1 hypothetical protein [Alteromonas sp.]